MAVSEVLIIAAPAAVGVSLAAPEEYSPALSVLLSSLGVGCGIISLNLTREGQLETAMAFMASIMFGLLSIAKTLKVI